MSLSSLVCRQASLTLRGSAFQTSPSCALRVCQRAFSSTPSVGAGFGLKDGVDSKFQSHTGSKSNWESRDDSRPQRRQSFGGERSSYGSRSRNSGYGDRGSFRGRSRNSDAEFENEDADGGDASSSFASHPRRRDFDQQGNRGQRRGSHGLRPRVQSDSASFLDEPEDGQSRSFQRDGPPRRDRVRQPGAPARHLFVGNVPFDTTEADIREYFGVYGEIENVRISADDEGRPRGFCHIDFVDQASAEKVMEEHANEPLALSSRTLRLDYAAGRQRRNY